MTTATNRGEELEKEYAKTKSSVQQYISEKADLLQTLETKESKVADLIDERNTQRSRQEVLKKEEELLLEHLRNDNRTLDAMVNEQRLIKDFVDRMEGFPDSVKFLNTSKKWIKAPLLSDIVNTSDEYKVLVENFLEPILNYYVVDTWTDAYKAIDLLYQAQKGKASFFVLESLPEAFGIQDSQGLTMLEVIDFDSKYQNLFTHLLADVKIFDHEENIVVTGSIGVLENGKLFKSRYHAYGGSVGLFEGKRIGRKKRLSELEKSIVQIKKKIAKSEDQFHRINKQNKELEEKLATYQIEEQQAEIQKITHQIELVQRDLQRSESLIFTFEEELSGGTTAADQFNLDIQKLIEKKGRIEKNIAELDELLPGHRDQFSKIKMTLGEHREKVQNLKIEHVELQSKLQGTIDKMQFLNQRVQSLMKQNEDEQRQFILDQKELSESKSWLDNNDRSIEQLYDHKKELDLAVQHAETTYYSLRDKIADQETQIRNLYQSISERGSLVEVLKEKKNNLDYQAQQIKDRLSIEFSYQAKVLQAPEGEISVDDLEPKVERLKMRIATYGDINPFALEAYNEMQERYDQIQKQREDILEAKQSLLQTIEEIETTASEQFVQAFETVSTSFKTVFRKLFSKDDDCDLVLLDPDNPLYSDIEILAKPKGKRPKSISQLSGGEKTLTATALLFSLYLLKPAPFCIFDEVDAPLDDQNIEKFNRIIQDFSGESQFVVITHNKLSMAAVDVIYGVHMQEQGVSGVTPVDLRSFVHDIA